MVNGLNSSTITLQSNHFPDPHDGCLEKGLQSSVPGSLGDIDLPEISASHTFLLVWSAADEYGIKRLSEVNKHYFEQQAEPLDQESFLDIVYTLTSRRSALGWRCFALTASASGLKSLNWSGLRAMRSSGGRQLAYVFNGQGAQYRRMGVGLLAYSAFRESLVESDRLLKALGASWSLLGNRAPAMF